MSAPRRRPPRARRRWPLVAVAVLATIVAFLLGVGLGLTLEERPRPGGQITSVRTLEPRSLPTQTGAG